MKRLWVALAVAAVASLALAGCVADDPDPMEDLVTEADPWLAELVPFVPEASEVQYYTYADGLNFPNDAPAYSVTNPYAAVAFFVSFDELKCAMTVEELTTEGDAARIILTPQMTGEDCGPYNIVKPYVLTLGSELKFSDIQSLEVCYEGECKIATVLPTVGFDEESSAMN